MSGIGASFAAGLDSGEAVLKRILSKYLADMENEYKYKALNENSRQANMANQLAYNKIAAEERMQGRQLSLAEKNMMMQDAQKKAELESSNYFKNAQVGLQARQLSQTDRAQDFSQQQYADKQAKDSQLTSLMQAWGKGLLDKAQAQKTAASQAAEEKLYQDSQNSASNAIRKVSEGLQSTMGAGATGAPQSTQQAVGLQENPQSQAQAPGGGWWSRWADSAGDMVKTIGEEASNKMGDAFKSGYSSADDYGLSAEPASFNSGYDSESPASGSWDNSTLDGYWGNYYGMDPSNSEQAKYSGPAGYYDSDWNFVENSNFDWA